MKADREYKDDVAERSFEVATGMPFAALFNKDDSAAAMFPRAKSQR